MFTGIVEAVGAIARIEPRGSRVELEIDAGALAEGVAIGSSIAVSGCCLTVTQARGRALVFEAVPETLRRTALGERRAGDRVNLERALRADARLDGHIVQGHVDGTGRVRALAREGDDVRMTIACEPALAALLVPKGSVTVDGVSLTVVDPNEREFSVALIPHTLAVTTLGERRSGDRVNLEADVLGKYVRHYVESLARARAS
jgi:riboflavin synthase alpha subunit